MNIHYQVRKIASLPPFLPKISNKNKLRSNLCINECELQNDITSYCELRNLNKDLKGELPLPSKYREYIQGYTDPNPTNCCNAWICPAGTEMGYPIF